MRRMTAPLAGVRWFFGSHARDAPRPSTAKAPPLSARGGSGPARSEGKRPHTPPPNRHDEEAGGDDGKATKTKAPSNHQLLISYLHRNSLLPVKASIPFLSLRSRRRSGWLGDGPHPGRRPVLHGRVGSRRFPRSGAGFFPEGKSNPPVWYVCRLECGCVRECVQEGERLGLVCRPLPAERDFVGAKRGGGWRV